MCGIAGLFHFDPARGAEAGLLGAMNRAIAHRGPDSSGVAVHGPAGVGSQRLAIIDPEGGAQPIPDADGSAWIVFNGEIYNHRELRRDLETLGHRFRTRTDTEVILQAYLRWGPDCVHRLNGMFAFAVWDERARRLFLARDRLGIKPLFFHRTADTFAFASEAKALLTLPWVECELDPSGLAEHLVCGYTLGRRTLFSGIRSVPAGHRMLVDAGGVAEEEYWDVPFESAEPDGEDPLDHLHALLADCVERELVADVPLGSCLSGGLDSGLVAALATRTRPGLDTFSIGYRRNSELFAGRPTRNIGEVVGDDLQYATLTAGTLRTRHHAFVLPVDTLLEDLDRMVWHREKPMITLSEHGHYRLSAAAVRTVKVLLSGQGSDELFGGYYYWWRFRGPENTTFFPWTARTDPAGPGYPVTRTDVFDHLVTPDFAHLTDYRADQQATFDGLMARAATGDFFNRISYLLVKTHLHEMLELEDRHAMAHSLETRVPFLDHRLVEWVLNVPGRAKVHRSVEKPMLRSMIRRHFPGFPEDVLARKKSPMPPPFETEEAVAAMRSALRRPGLAIEAYVDRRRLLEFLAGLETEGPGRPVTPRHYILYSLYLLERWHHVFRRRPAPVPA